MYRRQDPDREIGEDHGDPVGEQSKFSRSVTPEDAGDAVAGRGGIYGPEKNRHNTILEIIANQEIDTQEELARQLREAGYDVTQATVSGISGN